MLPSQSGIQGLPLILLFLALLSDVGLSKITSSEKEQRRTRLPNRSVCKRNDTHEEIFASSAKWEEWSADVTKNWRDLLPPYQLRREEDFNDNEPYGIALFHQIHCIVDIREHYSALLGVDGTTDEERESAKSGKEKKHMAHCFNWLRQVRYSRRESSSIRTNPKQAILCHADDTKELLQPDPNGGFIDQTKHVCGNATARYQEANGFLEADANGDMVWRERPTAT